MKTYNADLNGLVKSEREKNWSGFDYVRTQTPSPYNA